MMIKITFTTKDNFIPQEIKIPAEVFLTIKDQEFEFNFEEKKQIQELTIFKKYYLDYPVIFLMQCDCGRKTLYFKKQKNNLFEYKCEICTLSLLVDKQSGKSYKNSNTSINYLLKKAKIIDN